MIYLTAVKLLFSNWIICLQGQQDYSGAHTYERIDVEGSFHTEWFKLAKQCKISFGGIMQITREETDHENNPWYSSHIIFHKGLHLAKTISSPLTPSVLHHIMCISWNVINLDLFSWFHTCQNGSTFIS